MSTRLTNDIRDRIINAVMAHRFAAELKAIKAMEHALAIDIWNDIHDVKLRRLMDKLPDGYLTCHSRVKVMISSRMVELDLPDRVRGSKETHNPLKVYTGGGVIASLYEDYSNRKAKLKEDKDRAFASLKSAVYRYNTDLQLIEAWPEIASFVKAAVPARAALPALQIETLNQSLRLPPKKVA